MPNRKHISQYQAMAVFCLVLSFVLALFGVNAYLSSAAADSSEVQVPRTVAVSAASPLTTQADYTPLTGYEKLLETRTITLTGTQRDARFFRFTQSELTSHELRLTFTGDTPRVRFVQLGTLGDNQNAWLYWADIEPDYVDTSNPDGSVAYFSAAGVASKWASEVVLLNDNKNEDGSAKVALGDYNRFYLMPPKDSGTATVTRVALVGGDEPTHPSTATVSGLSGMQIVENMRIGWNLGNTLDAYYAKDARAAAEPDRGERECEQMWSNPATTSATFAFIKAQGFNAVRIPVTWFQHVYQKGTETYHIDETWMQRVHEVVDAAYDQGLYVILNTHHERLYLETPTFGEASSRAEKVAYLSAIWRQIATEFKDYDQRLVFEGLNEPRASYEDADSDEVKAAISNDREWGTPTDDDMATLNALEQAFVDAVRSVESPYRTTRLLIVPMMSGSSNTNISARLILPKTDGVTDPFIAVSSHPYQPYWFTSAAAGQWADYNFTGSARNRNRLESVLYGMYAAYTSKGIPVVLDETGASDMYDATMRPGHTEQRTAWAKEIVSLARGWGMTCFLWDNGSKEANTAGNEQGYVNRWSTPVSWFNARQEAVAKALISAATGSDAVAWGSAKNTPVPSGSETGKQLNEESETLTVEKRSSSFYKVTWEDLSDGLVAVEFSGVALGEAPVLILRDKSYTEYVDVDPSYIAWDTTATAGTAYFWPEHIERRWKGTEAKAVEHTLENLTVLQVRADKGCTMNKVSVLALPDGASMVPNSNNADGSETKTDTGDSSGTNTQAEQNGNNGSNTSNTSGNTAITYTILHADNNGVWVQGSGVPFVVSSNADFGKFVSVLVDGSVLGTANYTVHTGSTVVSLKDSYLATLSAGTHIMTIHSSDGDATATFTIQAASTSGGTNTSGSSSTGGTSADALSPSPNVSGATDEDSTGPSAESGTSANTPAGPWDQGNSASTSTTPTVTTAPTTTNTNSTTTSGSATTGTQSAPQTQTVSTASGTTRASSIPQTSDTTTHVVPLLVASAAFLVLCLVIRFAEDRSDEAR